jgi:long-chain acyl-CoA synthetase
MATIRSRSIGMPSYSRVVSLHAAVERAFEEFAERSALVAADRRLTYAELHDLTLRWARAIRDRGAAPGDCVALVLPNGPDYVAAYFGSLAAGATVVPLNVLLAPPEIEARVERARAAVTIVAGDEPASRPLEPEPVAADVAVLLFTSGTTGGAKGAELTPDGLLWNAQGIVDAFHLGPDDVQLAAAPLTHVLGMTGVMNATLLTGGALALMERFDAAAAYRLMVDAGVTGAMGAPPMFTALCAEARETSPQPPLRFVHAGGAALAAGVARRIQETFGCAVREGYGMTEVGGGIATTTLELEPKPGAVGRAMGDTEIRIARLDDMRGEVQVRSPSVMRGYRDDPEATAAVLDADGWLSTGDIGYLDDDGYLFLVDRKKELIIRGGYNVYPREVEEVLYAHPDVLEAAVIGVPDDSVGEEVVALVTPRAGAAPDAAAIQAWAKERVAAYKYPRRIVFVDELPKGPTGKILKRAIDRSVL